MIEATADCRWGSHLGAFSKRAEVMADMPAPPEDGDGSSDEGDVLLPLPGQSRLTRDAFDSDVDAVLSGKPQRLDLRRGGKMTKTSKTTGERLHGVRANRLGQDD